MIVCCGEALVDMLPRKGADGASVFQPFPGGSVYNVAVALGRLGVATAFFGGLSSDFFGTQLRDALAASRVDVSLANTSDHPTTLAFVTLAGGDAKYAFFDEHSAGRMLTENDLTAFPVEAVGLHFGSFGLAGEPCGSAFEALMRREHVSRVISLDPNIRPTLIKNREGYLARLDRLIAMSDIVKLSDDDLAWIAPGETFDLAARRWLDLGAKLLILTRSDGATAITGRHMVTVPAVQVKVADTIGAGDTFSAGVIKRLDERSLFTKAHIAALGEDQVRDILAFANRAAGITVSRPGADPPWLRELA